MNNVRKTVLAISLCLAACGPKAQTTHTKPAVTAQKPDAEMRTIPDAQWKKLVDAAPADKPRPASALPTVSPDPYDID